MAQCPVTILYFSFGQEYIGQFVLQLTKRVLSIHLQNFFVCPILWHITEDHLLGIKSCLNACLVYGGGKSQQLLKTLLKRG